jgi:hypothetical protein
VGVRNAQTENLENYLNFSGLIYLITFFSSPFCSLLKIKNINKQHKILIKTHSQTFT